MIEKRTYQVKAGQVWGPGDSHHEGDVVELTESEAEGFLDKLELVSVLPSDDHDADLGDAPEPGDIPEGDVDPPDVDPPAESSDTAAQPPAKKRKRG